MKKAYYLGIGLAIGLILVVGTFQFFPFQELLKLLLTINPTLVLFYLLTSITIFCLLALRWMIICQQQQVHIPFQKLLGYRFVGHAVSFITPGPRVGGEPVRAGLMKRNGIPFPRALSTVVADKTIEFTSFGVMFVIALTVVLFTVHMPILLSIIIFFILGIVIIMLIFGLNQMLQGKDPIIKIFRALRINKLKAVQQYKPQIKEYERNLKKFYGNNKRTFSAAFAVSCTAWTLSLVEFKIILLMVGINASIIEIFLVYTAVGLIYLFPIPLALGSLEAGQATLLASLGHAPVLGAAVAIITRGRDMLWMTIGFILLGYYGIGAKK